MVCKYCQTADCETKTCSDRARREKKSIWDASQSKPYSERPYQCIADSKRVEDKDGNYMWVGRKEFDSKRARGTLEWFKRASKGCIYKGGDFNAILNELKSKWATYTKHDTGMTMYRFTEHLEQLRKEGLQVPTIPEKFIEEMREAYPDMNNGSLNARMKSFA